MLYGVFTMLVLTALAVTYIWNNAAREAGAYYLAQNKFRDPSYACLEDFTGEGSVDGYNVSAVDDGAYRTLTLTWNTFLIPHALTFTFLTTPGCILD